MESIEQTYLKLLSQYPCDCVGNGVEDRRLNYQLSHALEKYYIYVYCIERKEKSFKFYPVTVTDEEIKRIYEIEFKNLVLESLKLNVPIEVLMSNKIEEYKAKFEENKRYCLDTPMEPYYGNPDFMFKRAGYILECIEKLSMEKPSLDDIFDGMKTFMEKYGNLKDLLDNPIYPFYDEEYKKDYRDFERAYYKILEVEKMLSVEVEKIWKSVLTDPNAHNDNSFKYLIHTFSSSMIPLESVGKVCCSLATNRLLTTPYGNTGIICDFDSEAIEIMCSKDAGSWSVDKNEFVERLFPRRWQVTNPDGIGVWFEEARISKLVLPNDLEKEANARNIAKNGEILNYSKQKCYSEIYFNSKVRAIGVFYTDECKDISAIKAYAEKYNLPLIHLSLQILRKNVGLLPKAEQNEEKSAYHY